MWKLCTVLFTVLLAGAIESSADEQIRRVQEELRKRNVYFGEIDGRKTVETTRAMRRYQERKGLKPTGEPDGDTLGALKLDQLGSLAQGQPDPNKTPPWPDVPVLKSDLPRHVKEEDRKFLESLESIAEPPEDETVPASPIPPERAAEQRAAALPPDQKAQPTDASPPELPASQLEAFIRSYLAACETNRLSEETAFYADKVKYFDHGTVDRRFIEKDVASFYKRWPERDYELLDFKLLQATEDEAVVQFRIGFRYRGRKHRVSGRTDNVFTIRVTPGGLKLVGLREQRVRE